MSDPVAGLLERGRAAKPHVSALDAVMGEDWAIVDFDGARKARDIRLSRPGLGPAHARDLKRGLAGGPFPGRRPQAVVKMIRKGGASDTRGLKAQIAYLSREGEVPLKRSEAFMGIEVDAAQLDAIETAWRMPPEGSGRADRTSHFIVSFPEDTPHGAAERAGRAWAGEMFGSGRFGGDSFDHYTAFHTDQAHPHMHVVVNRRGLENGEWLKVSLRGDLNYDRMREVLVDVAGREGIEMEATTRFARGIHDRPAPDAEYRLARRERRDAMAPGHTRETAIRAAASLIHFARRFAADAKSVERDLPGQAAMLRSISESIAEGRAITTRDYADLPAEREKALADRLEKVTRSVRGKFALMDEAVTGIGDGAERTRLLRQIAELKASTVPHMRDPGALTEFAERDGSGRYQAFAPSDPVSARVRRAADQVAREVATEYGVDPDATVERYSGSVPSRGLARQFAEEEARERAASRALSGAEPESADDLRVVLGRMHGKLGGVYREGRVVVEERLAMPADRDADKDRDPEIVDWTPWRDLEAGGGEVRNVVVKTDLGFHPGYAYASSRDAEDETVRHSEVAASTAEEAMELSEVFRARGERGVRTAMAERDTVRDAKAGEERRRGRDPGEAEHERILRDYERKNDADDYDR
jgi:type IV secretion system T-DNA border endonuclease VirD2